MHQAHIYAAPGFEEVELVTLVDILRRCGIDVTLVSLTETLAVAGAHAITVLADQPFSAMSTLADAIILPGGGPGTQALKACPALHERLHRHADAGKLVAAVCAAPTVLAHAGLLKQRRATCYPGCEAQLLAGEAIHCEDDVVIDGQIMTSRGAGTTAAFAIAIASALVGKEKAAAVGQAMLYPGL